MVIVLEEEITGLPYKEFKNSFSIGNIGWWDFLCVSILISIDDISHMLLITECQGTPFELVCGVPF